MFYNYLKIAFKVLLRRKFFTFISLFGISFTLVVLIVFSAMMENAVSVVKPESRVDRCLTIHTLRFSHVDRPTRSWFSSPGYKFLDRHVRTLPGVEAVAVYSNTRRVAAYVAGAKPELNLKRTDGVYWRIMDFDFLEGAAYSQEDEARGRFVAVINQATRDQYFRGESAVGKTISVDGQRFQVVGVVKNVPVYRDRPYSDVWVPISTAKSSNYRDQLLGGFEAAVLAPDRAAMPMIKAAFQQTLKQIDFPDPKNWNIAFSAADTQIEWVVRQFNHTWDRDPGVAKMAFTVLAAILLFMLLPAVNLININVSRIMERASEIGVRKAFGATSRTLTMQFLIENLILTTIGGALGFLGSFFILRWISRSGLIPYADFHVNMKVFLAGLVFTLFFGVFSGVYPAWRMSRLNPVSALKGGAS